MILQFKLVSCLLVYIIKCRTQSSPGTYARIIYTFKSGALKAPAEGWWASFLLYTSPRARAQVAMEVREELRRIDEYIEDNSSDAYGGPQIPCDGCHRSVQVKR
jgi:hypothetical protein